MIILFNIAIIISICITLYWFISIFLELTGEKVEFILLLILVSCLLVIVGLLLSHVITLFNVFRALLI